MAWGLPAEAGGQRRALPAFGSGDGIALCPGLRFCHLLSFSLGRSDKPRGLTTQAKRGCLRRRLGACRKHSLVFPFAGRVRPGREAQLPALGTQRAAFKPTTPGSWVGVFSLQLLRIFLSAHKKSWRHVSRFSYTTEPRAWTMLKGPDPAGPPHGVRRAGGFWGAAALVLCRG